MLVKMLTIMDGPLHRTQTLSITINDIKTRIELGFTPFIDYRF